MTTTDEGRPGRTRADDYATSEQGARSVSKRAPNQKLRLLVAYREVGERGATDEEAAAQAGLSMRSCYWKRAGELREDHLIEQQVVAGREVTRKGDAGVDRIVCVVTGPGLAVLRGHGL